MEYYDKPERAAEMSRTHRALSKERFKVDYHGRQVLGQILYERGDYRLTFAGLVLTTVRDTPYFHLVDKCTRWKAL